VNDVAPAGPRRVGSPDEAGRANGLAPPSRPMAPHRSHAVLIPSYNTGAKVYDTVREARARWAPVWVVLDGSTDGTAEGLQRLAGSDPQLHVLVLPRNQGKGAAVCAGLRAVQAAGLTHVLAMDADGQHPADLIGMFMATSLAHLDAMVLGDPVFDASAPRARVRGRRISNGWTWLETLGAGIDDSLFGFRVYPVAALLAVMRRQPWMRRFDFDTEAVVRLSWRGVAPLNLPAPVKYLRPEEGGVSHFNYLRDNLLLTWMHARLMIEFPLRLPGLALRRWLRRPPFQYLARGRAGSGAGG
jgi:glycosyltransferase involved in cell wall biosynthesis